MKKALAVSNMDRKRAASRLANVANSLKIEAVTDAGTATGTKDAELAPTDPIPERGIVLTLPDPVQVTRRRRPASA